LTWLARKCASTSVVAGTLLVLAVWFSARIFIASGTTPRRVVNPWLHAQVLSMVTPGEEGTWQVDEQQQLADRFEASRPRLRAVPCRLLRSVTEADDAGQDAWLRVSRADASEVLNLDGWFTTIISRVCLNGLQSARSHRRRPLDERMPDRSTAVTPNATRYRPTQSAARYSWCSTTLTSSERAGVRAAGP